jgi:hypothetical protein
MCDGQSDTRRPAEGSRLRFFLKKCHYLRPSRVQ